MMPAAVARSRSMAWRKRYTSRIANDPAARRSARLLVAMVTIVSFRRIGRSLKEVKLPHASLRFHVLRADLEQSRADGHAGSLRRRHVDLEAHFFFGEEEAKDAPSGEVLDVAQ